MALMDSLLAAPAAMLVVIATYQVRRALVERRRGTVLDLTDPAPRVDLEYLQARTREHDREVVAPMASEVSLGARLLAADRSGAHRSAPVVVVHRRRRSKPLVAQR